MIWNAILKGGHNIEMRTSCRRICWRYLEMTKFVIDRQLAGHFYDFACIFIKLVSYGERFAFCIIKKSIGCKYLFEFVQN